HGGVPQFGDTPPGGARLVYVSTANRNSGAAERVQSPLTPELLDEWIGVVRRAARASVGPTYSATPNPGCVHCTLTTSCPAQIPGKAVTDD
ncbi:PD-(D/E)XK nuclease family protein, partial [Gordonia terrae]